MPNYRKLGLPKRTGNPGEDIQSLRNAFYQQDEQLRYLFEHLDGGNFSDEFFNSINDGIARWNTENRVEIDTAGLVSEVLSAADDAFTRFEQTVQGITLTVVDSEGNETAVNLSSGKFDISFLEDQIDDAEKVATNFISMTPDGGIEVGNKSGDDWTGYRSQMLADSFNIVDAAGTVLASYGAQDIYLGKNNTNAKIYFCNGEAVLGYNSDEDHMEINTPDGLIIEGGAIIRREYPSPNGVYNFKSGLDAYDSHVKLLSEIYVNGNRSAGSSITLSGNIMTLEADGYISVSGRIRGTTQGVSWYEGRDAATLIATGGAGTSAYFPVIDAKCNTGDWSAGVLGDNFYFIYTKDSDYESGNNVTEKFWFEPRIGMRMSTSEAIDRYYVAYSSASGESYGCGFGIGSGGVNRGFYDYKRSQWTLYNDESDTIMRTTGAFYFYADTDAGTTPYGVVVGNAGKKHPLLRPVADEYGYLGGVDYRWHTLYTYNVNTTYAVNVSSDRRLKKDISYDLSSLDKVIDLIKPATYKLIADDEELIRFGFIAQDAEQAFVDAGLNPDDYAFISKDETENGVMLSLGYTETNALLWHRQQQLEQRIAELEKRIA